MSLNGYGLILAWDALHASPMTAIVASSEQVGFEAKGLKTDALAGPGNQWRSAAGALTNVTITIDLGSAQTVRGAALVGFNGRAGIATRRVQYSAVSDFSVLLGDSGTGIAIVATASGVAAVSPSRGEIAAHILDADVVARYVRWTLSDAGNSANYLRASVAPAGRIFQPGQGVPVSLERGTIFVGNQAARIPTRAYRFPWTLNEQEKADLESIIAKAAGTGRLLFMLSPDPARTRLDAIWCTHGRSEAPEDVASQPLQKKKWWSVQVNFVEATE